MPSLFLLYLLLLTLVSDVCVYIWRVSSQNALYPFWSIWDIWDLSCWNIKKIIRKFVILLIITSKIFLYIMSNVSLERYYFVLYDGALTLKISKMALNAFCDKTLHIILWEPEWVCWTCHMQEYSFCACAVLGKIDLYDGIPYLR